MNIRVVVSGRSYDASSNLPDAIPLNDGASVDDAIRAVAARMAEGQVLPPSCLVAVSGQHLGTLASHRDRVLVEGDEVVLIAPVAGG